MTWSNSSTTRSSTSSMSLPAFTASSTRCRLASCNHHDTCSQHNVPYSELLPQRVAELPTNQSVDDSLQHVESLNPGLDILPFWRQNHHWLHVSPRQVVVVAAWTTHTHAGNQEDALCANTTFLFKVRNVRSGKVYSAGSFLQKNSNYS